MIAESILNTRKFASGSNLSEKCSKSAQVSIIRSRYPRENYNMSSSKTNKQLEYRSSTNKRRVSPSQLGYSEIFSYLQHRSRNLKSITPSSNSFQRFDPGKIANSAQVATIRPISVGGKHIRPPFLEPEVVGGHYPNKSTLITPSIFLKEAEDSRDSYRFPLFRAKMISGFQFSLSPEPSELEMTAGNLKTPTNKMGTATSTRVQRNPVYSVSKIIKRHKELISTTKNQSFGFKNEMNYTHRKQNIRDYYDN